MASSRVIKSCIYLLALQAAPRRRADGGFGAIFPERLVDCHWPRHETGAAALVAPPVRTTRPAMTEIDAFKQFEQRGWGDGGVVSCYEAWFTPLTAQSV